MRLYANISRLAFQEKFNRVDETMADRVWRGGSNSDFLDAWRRKIHVNEPLFQPSRVQTASQSSLNLALRVGHHSDSESQRPIRSSSIYRLAVLFSNNRLHVVPFVFSSRAIDLASSRSFFSELTSLYPLAVLFSRIVI
jgi:hypothetical protein